MRGWHTCCAGETLNLVDDWNAQAGSDRITAWCATPDDGVVVAALSIVGNVVQFSVTPHPGVATAMFETTVVTASGQIFTRYQTVEVEPEKDCGVSKRDLIEQMFNECSLNNWEYDIEPDEKDSALIRLDALMWELRGRGLDVGYNFPRSIGKGSLNDALGCAPEAFYALSVLGAERLCPTMGKTQSRESRMALTAAMKALRGIGLRVPNMRLAPGTPIGAGNRRSYFAPFVLPRGREHRLDAPDLPAIFVSGLDF